MKQFTVFIREVDGTEYEVGVKTRETALLVANCKGTHYAVLRAWTGQFLEVLIKPK